MVIISYLLEIWWFFPSGESKVPNKYVIWNYVDNVWSIGNLRQICLVRSGVLDYPVACSSDGIVYEHESGLLSSSLDLGNRKPFATSGAIEIAQEID